MRASSPLVFFTLQDLTKTQPQSIRSMKMPILSADSLGVKMIPSHVITSMPVTRSYTRAAFFFSFSLQSKWWFICKQYIPPLMMVPVYIMQDNTPAGRSVNALLSKVYTFWCRNLVNDSESFVKISLEERLVISFLLCTLHYGNDLEDVSFRCAGHPWL